MFAVIMVVRIFTRIFIIVFLKIYSIQKYIRSIFQFWLSCYMTLTPGLISCNFILNPAKINVNTHQKM